VQPKADRPSSAKDYELGKLPTSRREAELLVNVIPREKLEHHMVLAPEVEKRFQRIEKEYAARQRLANAGLHPRRRILLFGPPGCGKTLGAKRLAWNTGLPLMKVRFDSLLSSYFGETASNLRSVFDSAASKACVLLIDECDSIARSRTNTRDVGEVARIVNVLLQFIDEYQLPGLLVAATNIDKSLDPALFRRFDDVFELPLPGSREIIELLRMTLSAVALAHDVDLGHVAAQLQGRSAADVVRVAENAAKTAILDAERAVTMRHLMDSAAHHSD
jgi:SpoVK/Ycf46/Vps4 family AAA+-type ATPase